MRKGMRLLTSLFTFLLILSTAAPTQLIAAAGRGALKDSRAAGLRTGGAERPYSPASFSPGVAAANAAAANTAAPEGTTPDCGGEGETPCGALTDFFWDNGNLFCDRGLQATGFKVLGGPIYFNANDWLNLDRLNITKGIELYQVKLPALQEKLSTLGADDFITYHCLGEGEVNGQCYTTLEHCVTIPEECFLGLCSPETTVCTPALGPIPKVPLPDFTKSGWTIINDLKQFVEDAADALNAANLPDAIKGIPGNAPTINFSFSADPLSFNLSSFESALESIKTFLTDNTFITNFKNLINDFVNPPGQCENRTRRQQTAADFKQTWTSWALLNQINLAKDEPVNWAQLLNTHNAFNNAADGYPLPNQFYSLTDQLNLGARSLSLDVHWFAGQVRLCHGKEAHEGCSGVDRYYANGIKELGKWLRDNPNEVVFIVFEDRTDGDHDEDINDPLAAYLNDSLGNNLVFTPSVAEEHGFSSDPGGETIWPSIQQIRGTGKRVILFSDNNHGGQYLFSNPSANSYANSRAKTFKLEDRCISATADSRFDFTRLEPDNKVGYFTVMYEARSLLDIIDFSGLIDEQKVAQMAKCQISTISLDLLHAKDKTGPTICNANPVENNFDPSTCDTPDTRIAAAVWSWRDGDKGDKGDAAMLNGSDGRWSSRSPAEVHPFACAKPRDGKPDTWQDKPGGEWKVTAGAGPWEQGDRQCRDEFGPDYTFGVPVIGWQNERLKGANTTAMDVWLNYNDIATEGTWVINRKPIAHAGAVQLSTEGQSVSFNSDGSADPEGGSLSYVWAFGDGAKGTGPAPTHIYADNGTYTATLTVTDQYGGVNSSQISVSVRNADPTLQLSGGNKVISENGAVTITDATFTDPGFSCFSCATQEKFSASVDWGEGTVTPATLSIAAGSAGVPSSGIITGSHLYGDNGTYTVKVCVTDDDEGGDCEQFTVTVNNVLPTVYIEKGTAVTTPGGQTFMGRSGELPAFSATAADVGTDDLTFAWSFQPGGLNFSTTYFNNGLTADPQQSPNGLFPFTISDQNKTVFSQPGVYTAHVVVTDDDGGSAHDSFALLITDAPTCTKDWKQQFGRRGQPLIETERLLAYLSIARFSSLYFNDLNLATAAQAEAILRESPSGNPYLQRARKEMLEAWLNFASGGIGWGDNIKHLNQPFSKVIADVEAILQNPKATPQDYQRASEAARLINQSICKGQ